MRQSIDRYLKRLRSMLGMQNSSIAYRESKAAIRRGQIPEKYKRLVDVIAGNRILEIGAAEGVLALLLARKNKRVIALERHKGRHAEALKLQSHWRAEGMDVDLCEMTLGDITDRFDLLQQVDTLVAVRMVYHLHEDIHRVFEECGKCVPCVVLCGNRWRARRYLQPNDDPSNKTRQFDYYASSEGMVELLEASGYTIVKTVPSADDLSQGIGEGDDPIVVGINRNLETNGQP